MNEPDPQVGAQGMRFQDPSRSFIPQSPPRRSLVRRDGTNGTDLDD